MEPRPAMHRLAAGPRATQKGVLLLVVVWAILAAESVLIGWTDVRMATAAALLPLAGIAAAAVLLHLATRTGTYGSAFGRIAFAYQVPAAVINAPLQAAVLFLAIIGVAPGLDDLNLLTSVAGLVSLVWSVVLTYLAVRVSLEGCAALGCTGAVLVVTMVVAVFGLFVLVGVPMDAT